MICNKNGITIGQTLSIASLITLTSVIAAIYLHNLKPNPIVPVTTLLSADYQMESAIIMQMQKYQNDHKTEPKSFEKEIMPGIHMSVICNKTAKDEWLFDAKVVGRDLERQIKVKGHSEIPDKLIFME